MYRLRMEKACQSDYAVLFWLRELMVPRLRFRLRGHVGVSYYEMERLPRYPPGMRWTVYEDAGDRSAGADWRGNAMRPI